MTTPKLQLPEIVVGQAGKELTHNQALAVLDQLAQAVVVDKDLAAPPGSPANGAMYIVAAGATGAWSGQSGKLAYWLATVAAWTFVTPANGWSVWVADEAVRYELKAGLWSISTKIAVDSASWGYASGAGGSVTQLTSKSAGVTLSKPSGQITMANSSISAGTGVSFTLTNTKIDAHAIPIVAIKNGATAAAYFVQVDSISAGSCVISVRNVSASPLSEAIVLQFNIISGSIA